MAREMRSRTIEELRKLAVSLGADAESTRWYLFGSMERNDPSASDIDLMVLCKTDGQADALRRLIDCDAFSLHLHLALMTFEEAAGVDAVRMQKCVQILL